MKPNTFARATVRLSMAVIALCFFFNSKVSYANINSKMKKKILFVVTSHSEKVSTGQSTGFYLSEVAHPWEALVNAGYEIDFVSPKGGKAPVDGFNLEDGINKKFWDDVNYRYKIEHTMTPEQVNPGDYAAIHYAGGHGTMWDFADNKTLATIGATIYENGGFVSAVCHGPAGLINIRLTNGSYLVDGKKINAFTNEEEVAVKLDKVVPFLLESELIERGAIFEKSGLWQTHVVSDQRVITGQNPQSASAVGEAIVEQLKTLGAHVVITEYKVQQKAKEQLSNVLGNYVKQALANENNLMAEVFQEQEHPTILWVFERWNSKEKFDEFAKTTPVKNILTLPKAALAQPVKTYHLTDLAPLSKSEWRKAPAKDDQPIVIMLFVDAKAGTEEAFTKLYDKAMPKFRSEPGVISYGLSQSDNNKTQFVTYEKFRNEDAFQYHLNFPPIKPVLDYLNTSIKKQPFQIGLHRLVPLTSAN